METIAGNDDGHWEMVVNGELGTGHDSVKRR